MREFNDKYTLILGGSTGLGMASAKKLALHGMNIIIVHRTRRSDMATVESDFEEIRSYGVKLMHFNVDATKTAAREEVISRLTEELGSKSIKCLLHSVAKGNLKPMVDSEKTSLQHDDFMLTIDAMGVSLFDWAKELLAAKLFTNDSRVLAFTSEGSYKAMKHYAAVSAAKAALEAIMRSIAQEMASFGVRANCIQAGITDTASLRMIPGSDDLKSMALLRNPSGRLTTPQDVAKVVYLLCKDEASWISGNVIKVDGGESIS